ncbi:MAG: SUMF1/EgtB/PvdO family nonheme iron enzyme [Bacteroidetes bacterium]|nr:SUMF1/EgtB/PvdO family nonheme iron enzyme [Bacteroidota bacterium]
MKKFYCLFLLAIGLVSASVANNIVVTNVSLTDQVAASHYCNIKFDISWDNSWHTSAVPNNWDAAWVFVKYRVSSGEWHHATLNLTGHTAPSGSTFTPSSDGKGVFAYRSSDGSGTNTWTNAKIRWNYGTDGVADDALLDIRVYAIEMVYIPEGSFYLGDGNGTNESIGSFHSGTTNSYVHITTTLLNDIRTDASGNGDDGQIVSNGIGIDGDNGLDKNDDGIIDNPTFPTGYGAFYIMKYEASQEQYVEFLNTLNRTQQNTRTTVDISGTSITNRFIMSDHAVITGRSGIRCDATLPASGAITVYCDYDGDGIYPETTDGQNLPGNYVTWMDIAAYMDWAALRPMTDPEFEKACRGPNTPVYQEYAWGTASVNSTVFTMTNLGSPNEGISNLSTTVGNGAYWPPTNSQIVRCGIFAASSTNHTRQETGASYYGVMELSGNLIESIVHIGSVAGRSFTGVHGNGELNTAGDADVDFWPGINGNATQSTANTAYLGITGVTAPAGSGWRGASIASNTATDMAVSYRGSAGYQTNYTAHQDLRGCRAVRTAP